MSDSGARIVDTAEATARERYQLLTSLVVPRPIAWVSTRGLDGVRNLAPFSYFAALSATPMLIGVSVGVRAGEPKDTLRNVRDTGRFCVNLVSGPLLEPMNLSSGEHGPEVDEFQLAGIQAGETEDGVPFVASSPAVLQCRLFQEVELGGPNNTLLIGEVDRVRLAAGLPTQPGTLLVDSEALDPVARLAGDLYARLGPVVRMPRPDRPASG